MLNVIDAKNDLQMMSDQQLLKKAKEGDPRYPQFLIVAEKQNRDRMRKEVAGRKASDQTVAEQIMYGGIQSQRPPQMPMMPPQMPMMSPQMPAMPPQAPMMPPQMAQAPQPPMQMMSDGGVVKASNGLFTASPSAAKRLNPPTYPLLQVRPEAIFSELETGETIELPGPTMTRQQRLDRVLEKINRGEMSADQVRNLLQNYSKRTGVTTPLEQQTLGYFDAQMLEQSREATDPDSSELTPMPRGKAPTNPYADAEGFMGLGYLARNIGEGVDKLSEYFKTFEFPDINFTGIDTLYDYDADSAVVDRIQQKATSPVQAQGITDASVQGTGSKEDSLDFSLGMPTSEQAKAATRSRIDRIRSKLSDPIGPITSDDIDSAVAGMVTQRAPRSGGSRGLSDVISSDVDVAGSLVGADSSATDSYISNVFSNLFKLDGGRRYPMTTPVLTPSDSEETVSAGSVAVGGSEENLVQQYIDRNDPNRVVRDAIEEGQGGQGNQNNNQRDQKRRNNNDGLVSLPSNYKSMFDEIIGIKDDADFVETPKVDFSGIRDDARGLGIATILGSIGAGIAGGNLSQGLRDATGAVDRLGKRLGDIGMAEKMAEQKATITDITRKEGRLDKLRGYGLQIRKLIEDARNARLSLQSAQVRSIPQMINNLLDFSDSVSMSERQQQGLRDAVAGLMADYNSLVSGQVDPRFKRVP